jgi:hypothetical protein
LATCSLGLERALAEAPSARGRLGAEPETNVTTLIERSSCDVLFRVGTSLLHAEVSRPAAAAIERVALQLVPATHDPRERASLQRLAADARTALEEGRPASLGGRLDLLGEALTADQLALLGALSDDLPALLAADGVSLERITSAAQLGRARSFLESL